jgi:hypothetical protein
VLAPLLACVKPDAEVAARGAPDDTGGAPVEIASPEVRFLSPAEGAVVSGHVTVSAEASGDELAGVAIEAEGAGIGAAALSPLAVSWDSSRGPDGPAQLVATVVDAGGRRSSATLDVVVWNGVTDPSTVAFVEPDEGEVCGDVPVEVRATGASAVELSIDGRVVGVDSAPPFAWTWRGADSGERVLTAEATYADVVVRQSVTVTAQGDTCDEAPTVSFVEPAYADCVDGTLDVEIDAEGAEQVRFAVDGETLLGDYAAPYAVTWAATAYVDGEHTLSATAVGAAETTTEIVVTVDTVDPVIQLVEPRDDDVVSGFVLVEAEVTEAGCPGPVSLTLNELVVATFDAAPYAWAWDTASWGHGAHRLAWATTDGAGHAVEHALDVFVDQPPTVAIEEPLDGEVVSGTVEVVVDAQDDAGLRAVELAVDGAGVATDPAAPFSLELDTCDLASGEHTLTIAATDEGGNEASASVQVTVDQPLAVSIRQADESSVVAEVGGDEAVVSVELWRDGAFLAAMQEEGSACETSCPCSTWLGSVPTGDGVLFVVAADVTGETVSAEVPAE